MVTTVPAGRDIRLDLFRGIALWLIYLVHIPYNIVNWVTIRNYGFRDAADLFVFISGYTTAFVYGRTLRERGVITAGARILERASHIYVAHVFLFVIYLAKIAYLGAKFDSPLFAEEFNVFGFLRHPDATLIQGLLLKFKPVNMDVLPLYIALMLAFPPVLWALLRSLTVALPAPRSCMRRPVILVGIYPPMRSASGTSTRSPGNCCSSSAPGADLTASSNWRGSSGRARSWCSRSCIWRSRWS